MGDNIAFVLEHGLCPAYSGPIFERIHFFCFLTPQCFRLIGEYSNFLHHVNFTDVQFFFPSFANTIPPEPVFLSFVSKVLQIVLDLLTLTFEYGLRC